MTLSTALDVSSFWPPEGVAVARAGAPIPLVGCPERRAGIFGFSRPGSTEAVGATRQGP